MKIKKLMTDILAVAVIGGMVFLVLYTFFIASVE